jgi:hypothetical protein
MNDAPELLQNSLRRRLMVAILIMVGVLLLFIIIRYVQYVQQPCMIYLEKTHILLPEPDISQASTNQIEGQVSVRVIGRSADEEWWQVQIEDQAWWITEDFTSPQGFCSNIPVTE